jgi:hypothetical protein
MDLLSKFAENMFKKFIYGNFDPEAARGSPSGSWIFVIVQPE